MEPDAQSALAVGTCTRMIRNDALEALLHEEYGEPGLCLKALRDVNDEWERQPLTAVSRVQNVGAMHNVAPPVYDVVRLPDGCAAQVTRWAGHHAEPSIEGLGRLLEVISRYQIRTGKWVNEWQQPKWDMVVSVRNWAGDWFLDWGGLYVSEPSALPTPKWARWG
ncbi:MAG: hypothetical protein PHQ60_15660 [Sideroxydans sp.]|nr:hypothetical protein [Sideroxydans sp.]